MSSASLAIQAAPAPASTNVIPGKSKGTEAGTSFTELVAGKGDARAAPPRGGTTSDEEALAGIAQRWGKQATGEEQASDDGVDGAERDEGDDAKKSLTSVEDQPDEGSDPIALLMSTVIQQPRPAEPAQHKVAVEKPTGEAPAEPNVDVEAEAAKTPSSSAVTSVLVERHLAGNAPAAAAAPVAASPRTVVSDTKTPKPAKDPAPTTPNAPLNGDAKPAPVDRDTDESALKPVHEKDAQSPSVGSGRRTVAELAREDMGSPRTDSRVAVTSVHVAPAPSAPVTIASPTGAALVASLNADGTLASYASTPANALPIQEARPVTTLTLQLQPVELGKVNVKISGSGEEIAIEIQVENSEARHRLSSDSDAIVKSLRGLGYEVDRVTVQLVTPSSNAGQQQTATGGRADGFAAFEQRGGERGNGQQNHSDSGGHGNDHERAAPQHQNDRGGGSGAVYI